METIRKILKANWYTEEDLLEKEINWICNWCWPKWDKFFPIIKIDPKYDKTKEENLLYDLDFICDIHDLDYNKGWFILDFIKANWKLANNIFTLIYWTNIILRVIIFIVVFCWTTLIWWLYFNWIRKN